MSIFKVFGGFGVEVGLSLATILTLSINATTVLYKDFNNLIDESDYVVEGTVSKIKAKKAKNGEIYTEVSLKDAYEITQEGSEALKKVVKIRYLGGEVEVKNDKNETINIKGMYAHGTPEFNIGDRDILFIKNNGIAEMPIYGWGQGLFHINDDETMLTSNTNPIIGLDGAHLLVKKNGKVITKNPKILSTKLHNNSKKPTLLKSDGGKDTLFENSSESNNTQVNVYNEMDKDHFISIVSERMLIKAKKRKDKSKLFALPLLEEFEENHIGNSITSNSIKTNTNVVLPVEVPKTQKLTNKAIL